MVRQWKVGFENYLNIQSSANIDFRIEVISLNGLVHFRNKYAVKAGHNQDHKITLAQDTPYGLLVVRLIFKDGSQKTVMISKSP